MRRLFLLIFFVIFAILFTYFFIPDEVVEIADTTATATSKYVSAKSDASDSDNNLYKINISAKCISNNSVGKDWTQIFSINDQQIKNGDKISIPKDVSEVKFNIYIEEDDTLPDIATKEIVLNLDNKKATTTLLVVTENKGRFTGNTAEWKISVSTEKTDHQSGDGSLIDTIFTYR